MQIERRDTQQENASAPISFKCDTGTNVTTEMAKQCIKQQSSRTSIDEGTEKEVRT
jgi:hypothetical protein